ncbi:DUF6020 family protein [Butyrivibrio sp. MC2013]|uniref:DUF6020 family protein n=1 Tax=Butyrivibrio sp. MC2013 TaxID=1280686 RepID=UPI000409D6CA|nr:DUF6020 family protein [Butyrivibrio sp. MC2013]
MKRIKFGQDPIIETENGEADSSLRSVSYYVYIIAFIMVWAVALITDLGAANILLLPLYAAFVLLIRASDSYAGRKGYASSHILSALYSFLYVFYKGESLSASYDNILFKAVVILISFCGLYFLFDRCVKSIFKFYGNRDFFIYERTRDIDNEDNSAKEKEGSKTGHLRAKKKLINSSAKVFLISFVIIIICYLPIYLYEYPGILTPDSINQIEQAIGVKPYSNHHPMAHTFIIGLFIRISEGFGASLMEGVALYTFFQMLMMALIYSYFIMTIYQYRVRRIFVILSIAFFALLPFQAVFAVSMWKDIFFAGLVLLYASSLFRLLSQVSIAASGDVAATSHDESTATKGGTDYNRASFIRDLIIHCLSFAGVNLFRSNGRFAMIAMLPVLLIWGIIKLRKGKAVRKTIGLLMAAWGLALILVLPVRYYFIPNANGEGVETPGPDIVENLAIPLQLFARVIYDGKELTAETRQLAESMMDISLIDRLYVPGFADNIKELVRAGHPEVLTDRRSQCIHAFIETGLTYPFEYIKAYRDMTCGYWFPDNPEDDNGYTVAYGEGICDNPLGLGQKWLIYGLPGKLLIKVKEIALKLGDLMPIYSHFFCMGTAFYLLLLSFAACLRRKESRDHALIALLPLFIMGTVMIATPVSNDFRYSYFLTDLIPMLLLLPVLAGEVMKPLAGIVQK